MKIIIEIEVYPESSKNPNLLVQCSTPFGIYFKDAESPSALRAKLMAYIMDLDYEQIFRLANIEGGRVQIKNQYQ